MVHLQISSAFNRPESHLIAFICLSTGVALILDDSDQALLSGEHDPDQLQYLVFDFIERCSAREGFWVTILYLNPLLSLCACLTAYLIPLPLSVLAYLSACLSHCLRHRRYVPHLSPQHLTISPQHLIISPHCLTISPLTQHYLILFYTRYVLDGSSVQTVIAAVKNRAGSKKLRLRGPDNEFNLSSKKLGDADEGMLTVIERDPMPGATQMASEYQQHCLRFPKAPERKVHFHKAGFLAALCSFDSECVGFVLLELELCFVAP